MRESFSLSSTAAMVQRLPGSHGTVIIDADDHEVARKLRPEEWDGAEVWRSCDIRSGYQRPEP